MSDSSHERAGGSAGLSGRSVGAQAGASPPHSWVGWPSPSVPGRAVPPAGGAAAAVVGAAGPETPRSPSVGKPGRGGADRRRHAARRAGIRATTELRTLPGRRPELRTRPPVRAELRALPGGGPNCGPWPGGGPPNCGPCPGGGPYCGPWPGGGPYCGPAPGGGPHGGPCPGGGAELRAGPGGGPPCWGPGPPGGGPYCGPGPPGRWARTARRGRCPADSRAVVLRVVGHRCGPRRAGTARAAGHRRAEGRTAGAPAVGRPAGHRTGGCGPGGGPWGGRATVGRRSPRRRRPVGLARQPRGARSRAAGRLVRGRGRAVLRDRPPFGRRSASSSAPCRPSSERPRPPGGCRPHTGWSAGCSVGSCVGCGGLLIADLPRSTRSRRSKHSRRTLCIAASVTPGRAVPPIGGRRSSATPAARR